MTDDPQPLSPALAAALEASDMSAALLAILGELQAESGTIHFLASDGNLRLVAHGPGMPPHVLEVIQSIPVGKGMAGLAAERAEPVTMCNLQTDESGDARPGAKATGLEGSIVVPIFNASQVVVGTLGVANRSARTFTDAETKSLLQIGRALAMVKR